MRRMWSKRLNPRNRHERIATEPLIRRFIQGPQKTALLLGPSPDRRLGCADAATPESPQGLLGFVRLTQMESMMTRNFGLPTALTAAAILGIGLIAPGA